MEAEEAVKDSARHIRPYPSQRYNLALASGESSLVAQLTISSPGSCDPSSAHWLPSLDWVESVGAVSVVNRCIFISPRGKKNVSKVL